MKHDTTLHNGVRAALKAMHRMLASATEETFTACGHIERGEQNLAIGTVMVVEGLLEQATILYKAVIAMHRCKL